MAMFYRNWTIQIRKGYLELLILQLVERHEKLYVLEILQFLDKMGFQTKEGTLYPLMNRLTKEALLKPSWVNQEKGVPKKYYSLTAAGKQELKKMCMEYQSMNEKFHDLLKENS